MRVCIKLLHVCHGNASFCALESWVCVLLPVPTPTRLFTLSHSLRSTYAGWGRRGAGWPKAWFCASVRGFFESKWCQQAARTASRRSRHAMPDQMEQEASTSPSAFVLLLVGLFRLLPSPDSPQSQPKCADHWTILSVSSRRPPTYSMSSFTPACSSAMVRHLITASSISA